MDGGVSIKEKKQEVANVLLIKEKHTFFMT